MKDAGEKSNMSWLCPVFLLIRIYPENNDWSVLAVYRRHILNIWVAAKLVDEILNRLTGAVWTRPFYLQN